jgi:hypothetical protein
MKRLIRAAHESCERRKARAFAQKCPICRAQTPHPTNVGIARSEDEFYVFYIRATE